MFSAEVVDEGDQDKENIEDEKKVETKFEQKVSLDKKFYSNSLECVK